ncbi:hypothetical protein Mapa_014983 [Marchantia paleacea]|nr:hypothetical protein Mapa_014983 [Marchantia paleacea]
MAVRSLSLSSGIAGVPCQFSIRESGFGSGRKNVALRREQRARSLSIRAQEDEGAPASVAADEEDDFEARLAKLQRKVTSGSGKKAEARKARKEGMEPMMSSSSSSTKDLFIPPVPLKEPVADGLVVELGMKPYTERLNGRLAALGLAAVLLVELATGDSFLHYHDSGTLFVQVYTVVGLAGLYAKWEKERISVWPKD